MMPAAEVDEFAQLAAAADGTAAVTSSPAVEASPAAAAGDYATKAEVAQVSMTAQQGIAEAMSLVEQVSAQLSRLNTAGSASVQSAEVTSSASRVAAPEGCSHSLTTDVQRSQLEAHSAALAAQAAKLQSLEAQLQSMAPSEAGMRDLAYALVCLAVLAVG